MKIRQKLSLLYSLMTAAILVVFAVLIYYSAAQSREKEFYATLKKEALTKANLFFDAKVDAQTLQTIYKNNRTIINEVEVAIYDTDFNLLFHDAVDIDIVKEDEEMINEIQSKNEIQFYQEKWQVVGLVFFYQGTEYILTAAAFDQNGYNKLDNMLQAMLYVFITSIIVIFITGRFFAKKALQPVSSIVSDAQKITASHLDLRIQHFNQKDELSELANTFNEMLDRLERSFNAQKEFVSHVAHEFRTPLAAIIAELELSENKSLDNEKFQRIVHHVKFDAKKLSKLFSSLLDFAKANYDTSEISFKTLRLDELLLDVRLNVLKPYPDYKINILFESEFDDDAFISVFGNEYLLNLAFSNLMENGCKYSPSNEINVGISYDDENIILKFQDKGIGISEEDLPFIFKPFFRGKNQDYKDGNGIGLSLTKKIIDLHNSKIEVISILNEGSIFSIEMPHL